MIVALPFADFAGNEYIRHEKHGDPAFPFAPAGFAAAPSDVEAEPARLKAADFGFGKLRKKLPDQGENPGVGGGVGPGGTSDRVLVDQDNVPEGFPSQDFAMRSRAPPKVPVQNTLESLVQDLVHEGALP